MSAQDTAAEADEFWLFGYGSLIWKPPPHFDRRIPGWVTGYVRRFWQDHRGTPEAPGRVVTLISRSYWEQLTDHHDSAPDKVWGVAYRITPDRVAEVKEYLDIREINGYTIHYTPFHPAASATTAAAAATDSAQHEGSHHPGPIRTLVYIGTPDNDQFVGPQDPQQLAEHIYRSSGPSGPNRDYLWGLEAALDELSPESGDEHVTDLSNRLRAVAAREEAAAAAVAAAGAAVEGEKAVPGPPVSVDVSVGDGAGVSAGPEQPPSPSALRREQQHHEQHHDFRKVSSIDEQEETEKTS